MATLQARLAALEARRRNRPAGRYGVVTCLRGETIDGAAARAEAEGYVGCLVVPGIMVLADWLTMVEADTREREARNHELVGDILRRESHHSVGIVTR